MFVFLLQPLRTTLINKNDWISVAGLLLLTVLVRGGIAWKSFDNFSADPDAYRTLAIGISETGTYTTAPSHGVSTTANQTHSNVQTDDLAANASTTGREYRPTAFRPPLYPWLLSWFVTEGQLSNFTAAVLNVLFAAITTVCVYWTAVVTNWSPTKTKDDSAPSPHPLRCRIAGFVAALLVLFDPVLLQQSTLVMTETLAAMLAAVALLAWDRTIGKPSKFAWSWAILFVSALAIAYLCRPTFLVWAACLFVLLTALGRRERKYLGVAMLLLVVVGGTIVVWTLRNKRQLDAPVWATTHGGYTLLLANNPLFYDYLRGGDHSKPWDADAFTAAYLHRYDGDPTSDAFWRCDWTEVPVTTKVLSEPADDKLCSSAAVATIKRQPAMFVWSSIVRVGRLWNPFPHLVPGRSAASVWIVGLYYCIFYALVLLAIFRLRRQLLGRRFWAISALAFTLTVVHAVYWSNLRMRAPVTTGIAVIIGLAVSPTKRNQDVCSRTHS